MYNELIKLSKENKEKSKLPAEDAAKIVDSGALRTLFDYLLPANAASRAHAGRAVGLAESADIDPGLLVRYPVLSQLVGTGLGGLAGAAVAGSGVLNNALLDQGPYGKVIPGALGGLLASLATIYGRRRNISRIQRDVKDKELKKIAPKGLGSMLIPFAAPTRRGHTDVFEALQTGKKPRFRGGRDAVETVLGVIPGLNLAGDAYTRGETISRIMKTR